MGLMITCSRSSSRSCISVGKSGKDNNPTAAIYVFAPLDSSKFGYAANGKDSALGVIYWLAYWITPLSKSSRFDICNCCLEFLIGSFSIKAPATCRICALVILLLGATRIGEGPLDPRLPSDHGVDGLLATHPKCNHCCHSLLRACLGVPLVMAGRGESYH
jgi:hypothetical protein